MANILEWLLKILAILFEVLFSMSVSASQLTLIPARYYLRLLKLLATRNIPIQEILDTLNLDIEQYLAMPDLKLSLHQVESVIEYALKYPGNTDLAFELGRSLKLSSHHLVGYAVLSSQTLEQAIRIVSLYFSLIIPNFKISISYHKNGFCELNCEPIVHMKTLSLNFHLEAIAIAIHYNMTELIGKPLPPYQIFLSMAEPIHIERYQTVTSAKFHFNMLNRPGVKFILHQDTLKYELPLSDEFTLKAIEQNCQEELQQITQQQDFVEWVKFMMSEAYQIPKLSDCATLLNVSTKTLQRYLKQHGADFNRLKNDVLIQKAHKLLNIKDYSITQIAYELGYSSTSNFSRAFKLWHGQTPEQYRSMNLNT